MERLQDLLYDQGSRCTLEIFDSADRSRSANAIRDYQFIKSLDYLPPALMDRRREQCNTYFPHTARSVDATVLPFDTENYRCLTRDSNKSVEAAFAYSLRELMRIYLPVRYTWTAAERADRPDMYAAKYAPITLAPGLDRLARSILPLIGALFLLVPIYIMALQPGLTTSLVTTTIAVILFTLLCGITMGVSSAQAVGTTAGYAAVLVVFVGLANENF